MITVSEALTPTQLDEVRALIRAFVAWHRERHAHDLHLIDAYFDAAAFEDELATLPGGYAPPSGALLLATQDGESAGCVALRKIDADYCEMKRMFVYPKFHGQGVGLALARRVIGLARNRRYKGMRLDTSVRQAEAKALYAGLGFSDPAVLRTTEGHARLAGVHGASALTGIRLPGRHREAESRCPCGAARI